MKSVGRVILLVVGLLAGGVTACEHGRCELDTGMATCSSMNQAGCRESPPCRWVNACVEVTSCEGANRPVCEELDFCIRDPDYCWPKTDPCEPLSLETCTSDNRCGAGSACRGALGPCEPHDDEDSCEADLHCNWQSSPAF